ncbi:hypothetical protein, partial [Frankia sp. EI5c]|uniref:hypothetical protein n=1 Tax=Frankia sp. EI5c TaxID=683316 RepID=UPI001A7F093C
MPDQPEGTAARAEALARAETGLVLATLAPFAMLIPILVVLGWWDRGTTVIDAVVSAVAVPILTAVFATAVPFAFAMQRFGNDAYSYDLAAQETRPVDWAAPKWAPVGEVVTSLTGLPATSVPAVFLITPTANLAVVHRPSQAPGRLGRASDWSVRHRRPLMAA